MFLFPRCVRETQQSKIKFNLYLQFKGEQNRTVTDTAPSSFRDWMLCLLHMLLYLCDQQLYVLFKAVQESLQGAGVGSAALPSPDFWQSSMFVLNLSQDLKKKTRHIKQWGAALWLHVHKHHAGTVKSNWCIQSIPLQISVDSVSLWCFSSLTMSCHHIIVSSLEKNYMNFLLTLKIPSVLIRMHNQQLIYIF